ncbi:MAG: tetratricopeptide repeat protein [Bacteroidetes bacterium]|nr:tetratricopeptide repeat protein [Bacteroidota bacterium]
MKKILFMLLCWQLMIAHAQQTVVYTDAENKYRLGLELFNKQKYGAAQKEFDFTVASKDVSADAAMNSAFLAAKCAVELFNKDAEYRFLRFMDDYPESPRYSEAQFELGKYYYKLKRWKKAIEWFAKIEPNSLSQSDRDEFYFKSGYAYYMTNDYDKSGKAFFNVKDGDSKYASAAQYYYAHMMYVSKNYETALKCFLKLQDSEAFGGVAPYYITQIYYLQGKYDEVLKYAPSLMDKESTKNAMEIGRMIGESNYRKGNYKDAIPYISDYEKNSGAATRVDYYQLGYSYAKTGDCEKAIPFFKRVADRDDSLAQYGYYQLADCFLKAGNKQSARTAFLSAGNMKYDETIQEESKFNFAKLSYELNFQSKAMEAFKNYLSTFPQGKHADESNEMLVSMYASTKNYRDAMAAIENIKNKTDNIKAAYQRVSYYRGVELYMDNKLPESICLLNASRKNPYEQKLVAAALYWTAEAQFKQKEYNDAQRTYNDFLFTPAALKLDYYNLANYNLGYCYFKQENYTDAQSWFRKYIKEKSQTDNARYNDALLRIADSFFMIGDRSNAADYYSQAIDNKAQSSDYALYQKAVILGIQNKTSEKVTTLQKIFNQYPKSIYFDDALYEAANASLIKGDNDQASTWYKKIINDYPQSSYVKKAMLGLGLVQYNSKQDEAAVATYKSVVNKYPNTAEAKEALAQLKNISVSQNKVEDYLAYIKNVPNADVSLAAQDSLVYESAELRYTQGNCESAVKEMENYLQKFPEGAFRINATYYKADCQYRDKQYESALSGYNFVISQTKNAFTEKSLLNAALINFRLKQYNNAQTNFEQLESVAEVRDNIIAAQAGQMRCAYNLLQYDKAISNADKLIGSTADKDLQNEAHLIKGLSSMAKEDLTTAKAELTIVSKRTNSEMTAEANYHLAVIEYKLTNYKECKEQVIKLQDQVPSYDYWIAKGFILLGDNYLAQRDTFQAKETFKSIIENYQKDPNDPEDLKSQAQQKFGELVAAEHKNVEIKKPEMEEEPVDTTGN